MKKANFQFQLFDILKVTELTKEKILKQFKMKSKNKPVTKFLDY